jgi:PAS domain S-box-containing protein
MRDSEQWLRAVLTSLPVLVVAYDHDMVCTIAEGRGLEALGRKPEELVGLRLDDLIGGLAEVRENARRALDGAVGHCSVAVRGVVMDTYHSPLRDREGRIIGGLAVAVDVTERQRAELAAQQANDRFQRGFVSSPLGMAITDAGGSYLQVNPSFCAMLGRDESELLGRHYREATPDWEMAYADDVLRRLQEGSLNVYQGEERFTHPRGAVVHALVTSTAVRDDNGTLLYCLHQVQDITERRHAEEALRDSLERLHKADAERQRLLGYLVGAQEEERARIAADVHDDSLQALAAVKMRLEMLVDTLDDEQRARLRRVERDLDAAAQRLRKLLFQLRPSALDHGTLGHAIEQLLAQSSDGRVTVRVHDRLQSTPPAPTRVVVYRIVQEAVANVHKHARARTLEIHLDNHDAGVLVTVRDDGVGFDFEQARRSQLPGHLGLSTMRERAEMVGGWLSVESTPGRGTVVGFWIPLGGDERSLPAIGA